MLANVIIVLPSARLLALALVATASLLHFSGRLPDRGWMLPMLLVLMASILSVPTIGWLQRRLPAAMRNRRAGGFARLQDQFVVAGLMRPLPAARLAVALLLAMLLLASRVHDALGSRLPPALEGLDLEVVGVVDGMPQRFDFGDRIRFTLADCRPADIRSSDSPSGCGRLQRLQLDWGPLAEKHRRSRRSAGQPLRAEADSRSDPAEDQTGADADDRGDVHAERSVAEGEVWPRPGEYWRLTVRLKRPVAPVNPAGLDLELRYLQQGIGALGRVYARERLQTAPSGRAWRPGAAILIAFEGWRTTLRDRIEAVHAHRVEPPGGDRSSAWALLGVVAGLALGDQGAIGAGLWGLFSRTGVSHLMAISGMHVTMLALLAAWLAALALRLIASRCGRLWRLGHLLARWPRQALVLGIAMVVAFGYALLSGWGIPSQRTCWMLSIAAATSLTGRGRGAMDVTLLAAAVVVAVDPWAVSTAGFWLSFGAVAAILWCAHGQDSQELQRVAVPGIGSLRLHSALRGAANSQWAATIGLAPLVAALFSTLSLIGPLANAFAIPWVSFLITPIAVAAALLAPLAEPVCAFLLQANLWMIGSLIAMLEVLDRLPAASVAIPAPGPWTLICAVVGAAVTIAPPGFPMRAAAPLCLVPMLLTAPRVPARDELWITALDIGQGSSILVEAGEARLLVDPGPGSGVDRSAASRFLVPYLRSRGIDTIHTMAVSHLDAQHAGGTAAVLQSLRPTRLLAAFDERLLNAPPDALTRLDRKSCVAGLKLMLGVATIEVLHPPVAADGRHAARDDSGSCVLRIRSPAGSVLLAGDLPSTSEASLVSAMAQGPAGLRSDVLVVPQQGSRNATGKLLLAAAQPAHALLQVGYRNRHRHPHPAVLERLGRAGVRVLRTDFDGAVQLRLHASRPPQVSRWRRDAPPYWRLDAAATD